MKVGYTFWDFRLDPKNRDGTWGSTVLNLIVVYVRLAWSTILIGQARKSGSNDLSGLLL